MKKLSNFFRRKIFDDDSEQLFRTSSTVLQESDGTDLTSIADRELILNDNSLLIRKGNEIKEVSGGTGQKGDTGDAGVSGADGINGVDGASAFVYIAYASDDTGTDFTTTFDPNLDYIAILSTDTEIASPSASDFTGLWKNYKGSSGSSSNYEFFPFYPVSAAGIGTRPANYAISDYSVAWSAVTPTGSQTVQKDFGAAYFDADFEIQFEFGAGVGCANSSIIYFLMLTNTVNTYTAIIGASGDLLCLFFNQTAGGAQNIGVRESNNASITTAIQAISKDVVYYCTLIRDESVGTYGRLTLNMYSDATRITLAFTLYIDLTEKQDFQYLIVGSGAGATSGSALSFGVVAHLEIISA